METISLVLLLLLAVVVSSAVARVLPVAIPTPLVQIALGAVIGLSTHIRVDLDPEIFFLLFLPPLLFLDGWRIPKDELLRDWPIVLELALGLVVVTVVGAGFLIHWMIPVMPLAVAFALAAVLSPTDPIAVSAIAARVSIPKRMMHILEGESLFNDASGLVCLRFAIAAALTGRFSAGEAAASFAWAAGGGLAIGITVTLSVTWLKSRFSERFGEDAGTQILVSLLIPFGAYLLAEHLHCSGILAAVAAGVTMTFAEISRDALPATRMRQNSVWDMIQFAGNGAIFVLLGEQLPTILSRALRTVEISGRGNAWWLLAYVAAITIGLALLRFAWVWGSLRLTLFRKRTRPLGPTDLKLVLAMSFAGVRGAITLAGVMTLPLTMGDGSPFPARDLAIFLAAGAILLSLMTATVVLPLLLHGLRMPPEPRAVALEDEARVALSKSALKAIERQREKVAPDDALADVYDRAAARVGDLYRERIQRLDGGDTHSEQAQREERIERELRLAAIQAQRQKLRELMRGGKVGSSLSARLTRELDLLELRQRSET
ncbi:Na+/H+ antiporter [Sphingomonas oryzagri]